MDRCRRGEGPAFLLVNTYRFTGHHVGDISRDYYRSKQEEQKWKTERDPIKILGDWLIEQNLADRAVFGYDSRRSEAGDGEGSAVRDCVAVSEYRQSGGRRLCVS